MEKNNNKPNTLFSSVQNVLASIAVPFYLIYRFYLSDPKIIKDLGSVYPWFVMVWVIVMLTSAGVSGTKVIQYAVKYLPLVAKAINIFKKDITHEE
jgi:hypothetical protein